MLINKAQQRMKDYSKQLNLKAILQNIIIYLKKQSLKQNKKGKTEMELDFLVHCLIQKHKK